jgi:hypothetical protein
MEASSNDLYQLDDKLPVQEWQKEILDERERLIEKGRARFVDWEEVKKRLALLLTT